MAVAASAIWRVRPSGNNSNGGGYDGTSYPGGTDYSQQNAAQYSPSSTLSTSAANSTTLLDSGNGFTSAMVGNAIQITAGTNFTAGVYFIKTFNSAGSVTLDRTPTASAAGSAGSGSIGGAWANFWTNLTGAKAFIVPGNTIYILGGASPSYGAPDYTATDPDISIVSGNVTTGRITLATDPNTPSTNGFGGRTLVGATAAIVGGGMSYVNVLNLWLFRTSNGGPGAGLFVGGANTKFYNCVFDQNGFNATMLSTAGSIAINCEVMDSTGAAKVSGGNIAVTTNNLVNCNIHDCIGPGIGGTAQTNVIGCIIANNGGYGLTMAGGSSLPAYCINNTIDSNGGDGLRITSAQAATMVIFNNVISNHVTASTFGMNAQSGTTNDITKLLVDYNVFYGNKNGATYQDLNLISYGAHDTSDSGTAPNSITAGTSPYVAETTENYALA